MESVFLTIRTTILMALRTLPIILISFIGFLAAGLGNMGLFILFVGHVVLVPIATLISQTIFSKILGNQSDLITIPHTDKAFLVPSSPAVSLRINVAPSYWMAHIIFFLSYICTSANAIFNLPEDSKSDAILISNRKSKARMIIITTIFFAIVFSFFKITTGTETLAGLFIGILLGGILGFTWYKFGESSGTRAADIFGIIQHTIPSSASNEKPMTCVYAPKP